MSPKSKPVRIIMGSDGIPVEPRLRRIAVRLKYIATSRSIDGRHMAKLLPMFFPDPKAHDEVRAVAEAMEKAGSLDMSHGYLINRSPLRKAGPDLETKLENYAAISTGAGSRLGENPQSVQIATDLFVRLRNIYGLHRISTSRGTAVFVPLAMSLEGGIAWCSEAMLVVASVQGMRLLHAPPGSLVPSADPETLLPVIDFDACVDWPDEFATSILDGSAVSPFTEEPSGIASLIGRLAKDGLRSLRGQRAMAEVILGHPVHVRKWQSFCGSLERASNLSGSARRVVFSILEPDVRLATMRDPRASFRVYNWLCGQDAQSRERRLQASAAFPLFTRHLWALTQTIDHGDELLGPLASLARLSPHVVRHLGGKTWQRVGGHFYLLKDTHWQDHDVIHLLSAMPPEWLPQSKADWANTMMTAESLGRHLGWPLPAHLVRVLTDPVGGQRLLHADVFNALQDTATYLDRAIRGEWRTDQPPTFPPQANQPTPLLRGLLSTIAGAGSRKRLLSFAKAWHRDEPWRSASLRAIRRELFGESTLEWPALTEPFKCEAGTLTWLCDEDQLAMEGSRMRHCVGSYSQACLSGASHIGRIMTASGQSSTVEIRIEDEHLITQQHRAYRNTHPSPEADVVLQSFFRHVKKPRNRINFTQLAAQARDRVENHSGFKITRAKLSPEMRDTILRLYDSCLPAACSEWSPLQWQELAAANADYKMVGFHGDMLAMEAP